MIINELQEGFTKLIVIQSSKEVRKDNQYNWINKFMVKFNKTLNHLRIYSLSFLL